MRTRNRSQLTQEQEQQIIEDQIRAMEMKALKNANKTFPDTYYKILLKKFYIYFRKILQQNQDENNQLKYKIQNIIFNSFLPKKLELNDKNDAKNNPVYLFADGKDAQQYNTLEELCIGFNTIYGSKFYQQRSLEKLLTQFQMTFPRYLKDLYFNLSQNNVKKAQCQQIKNLMLKSKYTLENFGLDVMYNNNFKRQELLIIAEAIEKLSNLKKLSLVLSQNMLEGEEISQLSKAIGKLNKLENIKLELMSVDLEDQDVKNLVQFLQNISQSVKVFCLDLVSEGFGKLTDECVKFIYEKLVLCTNLEKLTLRFGGQNLSATGAQYVAKVLEKLQNLKVIHLSFSQCQIKEGIVDLGKSLKQLQNLKDLVFISSNSDSSIQDILQFMKDITSLNQSFQNGNLILSADNPNEEEKKQIDQFKKLASEKQIRINIF